jgi:hypothetical protein
MKELTAFSFKEETRKPTAPAVIPYRLKNPNDKDWEPQHTLIDILEMMVLLEKQRAWGPYELHFGRGWEKLFDRPYYTSSVRDNPTTKKRIFDIESIVAMETHTYIGDWDILLVPTRASKSDEDKHLRWDQRQLRKVVVSGRFI